MNSVVKRLMSIQMRELLLTDPSLLSSKSNLLELVSRNRKNIYTRITTTQNVLDKIKQDANTDVIDFQEDTYYAFGPKELPRKNLKYIDTLISDSGMLCIIDINKWSHIEFSVDWREYLMNYMTAGSIKDLKDEYPMFEWLCSSADGTPEFHIYGTRDMADEPWNGILICQTMVDQGSNENG